jgi:hypothetical protein
MGNIKFHVLLVISIMFVGCTRKSGENGKATEDVLGGMICYAYTENKDTIQLQITTLNDSVAGRLTYNLFEKDMNSGTLAGRMQGDTLFADYTFRSEGVESIREVAFFRTGENLIELFGEVENVNGTLVFKKPYRLELNERIVLKWEKCL